MFEVICDRLTVFLINTYSFSSIQLLYYNFIIIWVASMHSVHFLLRCKWVSIITDL